ncbi:exopolysaccharide biosynthesis protein [Bradyrhizobium sp. CCBAU 11357]|uniref:exopolysaccharide biosynthesis protein n=1 Tax=Bradyrhizobium sp. CCBAU 11357 TaxID=1630808 RepID=UPI003FA4D269
MLLPPPCCSGPFHLGLADARPSQAILRDHHDPARAGRARTGLSIVAGLLLTIPAFQMIAGKPAPVFPRRIATLSLPTKHLAAVVQRSLPVLRYLEKVVHPRWRTRWRQPSAWSARRGTERYSGLHSNTLSNVVPALVICLDLPCLSRGGWGPVSRSPCWPPPFVRSRRR